MSDGSVTIDTKLNNNGFEKGISKLENIGKRGLKSIGTVAGIASTAIGTLGTYAIKVGMDFKAGMSKVQAISGATGEELNQLTEKAKEMGAKTKFSASESAEAFQYMAMAGWKTGDMLNGIEGIMNLAAASGENLGSVSDIVTDALTAFGLQAKDSAHFADVLAKASSNSNTNVGLMGATFKYVAPIAGNMKYSIEDTALAIGLMANAGIKGEQAGTALRSMLTRLVKPPKEASEALKNLNISAKNSDGTMKPLSQTLKELREKFATLNDSQKASYASSIAGTEAMSGMLAIVNASDEDFNKLAESINNSDGAAENMANTMNDNLAGSVTILKSNMETFGLSISDKFEGPAKKGIESVTKVLENLTKSASNGKLSKSIEKIADSFGKLIEKSGKLIEKVLPKLIDGFAWVIDHGSIIAKVIGVISTAIAYFKITANISKVVQGFQSAVKVLNTFEKGTKGLTIAQGVLNGSFSLGQTAVGLLTGKISLATVAQKLWNMAMSANPVGIVVAGVGALIAVLGTLAYQLYENEKKTKETFENMGKGASDFITGISTAKSHLEDFNSTLFASSEEQQQLQQQMDEVQSGITKICKTASDERRGYTQEEITQLDEYFQKLRELNEREIQIQQSIADAITQQAVTNAQTFKGSLEEYKQQSQQWLKTAEDQKTKTVDLINQQTIEEVALLNQRYTTEEQRQSEAYVNEYNEIQRQKEEKIAQAQEEVAKINEAYTNGYIERAKQEDGWYKTIEDNNKKIEDENNRHNSVIEDIEDSALLTQANKNGAKYNESYRHQEEMKKIWKQMYKNMSEEEAEELGSWLARLSNTEMWGGKISEENQKIVDTILDSYEDMPDDAKNKMKETMAGMFKGMEEKEPTLYTKASGIADGILSRLKKSFDIHSPSKKTKQIFKFVMLGGEEGLEAEEQRLYKRIGRIVKQSNQLFEKMRATVEFETSKLATNLSTKATLEIAKDQPRTVTNEHGVTINNTQQFYSKNATPYEEQKQAKQQLRRLAYGL